MMPLIFTIIGCMVALCTCIDSASKRIADAIKEQK